MKFDTCQLVNTTSHQSRLGALHRPVRPVHDLIDPFTTNQINVNYHGKERDPKYYFQLKCCIHLPWLVAILGLVRGLKIPNLERVCIGRWLTRDTWSGRDGLVVDVTVTGGANCDSTCTTPGGLSWVAGSFNVVLGSRAVQGSSTVLGSSSVQDRVVLYRSFRCKSVRDRFVSDSIAGWRRLGNSVPVVVAVVPSAWVKGDYNALDAADRVSDTGTDAVVVEGNKTGRTADGCWSWSKCRVMVGEESNSNKGEEWELDVVALRSLL